jgi:hypothetical protein
MRSNYEVPAVLGNAHIGGGQQPALLGVGSENRIRVVDVQVGGAIRAQRREQGKTFDDRHVAHVRGGASRKSESHKLVSVPKSSVEPHAVARLQLREQRVIDHRHVRKNADCCVTISKNITDGMHTRRGFGIVARRSASRERHGAHLETGRIDGMPLIGRGQPVQPRIRSDHMAESGTAIEALPHGGGSNHGQRPAFAKLKNAERVIEIGVREKNAAHGRVPCRIIRFKARANELFDLPAHIGRRIDEVPVASVTANGDRTLQTGWQYASTRETAILAGAIPLGKATPGSSAEDQDFEQTDLAGA